MITRREANHLSVLIERVTQAAVELSQAQRRLDVLQAELSEHITSLERPLAIEPAENVT